MSQYFIRPHKNRKCACFSENAKLKKLAMNSKLRQSNWSRSTYIMIKLTLKDFFDPNLKPDFNSSPRNRFNCVRTVLKKSIYIKIDWFYIEIDWKSQNELTLTIHIKLLIHSFDIYVDLLIKKRLKTINFNQN